MKLTNNIFNQIYHKYLLVEGNELTEICKAKVKVNEDDCFLVVTSQIDDQGVLQFPVLSIGSSAENCLKGVKIKAPLAIIPAVQFLKYDFKIMQRPSFALLKKAALLFMKEPINDELKFIRKIKEIDSLRQVLFPDTLTISFITKEGIFDGLMDVEEYNAQFLVGKISSLPKHIKDHQQGELVESLPIVFNEQVRLVVIEEDQDLLNETTNYLKKLMTDIIKNNPEFGTEGKS